MTGMGQDIMMRRSLRFFRMTGGGGNEAEWLLCTFRMRGRGEEEDRWNGRYAPSE